MRNFRRLRYSPLAPSALAPLVASLGCSSWLSLACAPFCDSSMKRAVRPVRVWVPVFLYNEVRWCWTVRKPTPSSAATCLSGRSSETTAARTSLSRFVSPYDSQNAARASSGLRGEACSGGGLVGFLRSLMVGRFFGVCRLFGIR